MEVFSISVSKEKLLQMPSQERILFLHFGYVSNQLSMLQKLLNFSTNVEPEIEIEQHSSGAQSQMLARLTVGALQEAWALIRTRYLGDKVSKDYNKLIDAKGLAALSEIKIIFGQGSIISKTRNSYGFHYPDNIESENAFRRLMGNNDMDGHLNIYASHHGFNSLYLLSDLVFLAGIAEIIGASDLDDSQEKLMAELCRASICIIEFVRAYTAACWLKNIGPKMIASAVINITSAPKLDAVPMPYFVEVDGP